MTNLTLIDLLGSNRWEDWKCAAKQARELKKFIVAQALLDESLESFGENTNIIHEMARLAEEQCNWGRAETLWRRFISIMQVPMWWSYTSLGSCLYRQGNDLEGARVYREARSLFRHEPHLFIQQVLVLLDVGRAADTTEVIKSGIDDITDWSERGLEAFGRAALAAQDLDLVVQCAVALKTTPGSGPVRSMLESFIAEVDPLKLSNLEAGTSATITQPDQESTASLDAEIRESWRRLPGL